MGYPHPNHDAGVVLSSIDLAIRGRPTARRALIHELTERVSADPFGESSHPDFRIRLSELRTRVDQAADELIDALARMGEAGQAPESR